MFDDDCSDDDCSDDDTSYSHLTEEELDKQDQLPDLKYRREIEAVYYDVFSAMSVNDGHYEDNNRKELWLNGGTPIREGDVTWVNDPKWKELNEAYIAVSFGSNSLFESTSC